VGNGGGGSMVPGNGSCCYVVTGGNRGLGYAIVQRLIHGIGDGRRHGGCNKVILTARTAAAGAAALRTLLQQPSPKNANNVDDDDGGGGGNVASVVTTTGSSTAPRRHHVCTSRLRDLECVRCTQLCHTP